MAVKKKRLARRVIGVTAHRATLKKAIRRGAVDAGTLSARNSVSGSDLVILAAPPDKITGVLKKIAPRLKKGCIVIDAASVKGAIVPAAEKILKAKAHFVGSHPMAGSEKRGIDKADAGLFRGAICILTRTRNTDKKALKVVSGFWEALGSKIRVMSVSRHDKIVSSISHLPHIAASALSLAVDRGSLELAAGGFKDTTRVASGSPGLWAPIFTLNRGNIAGDIEAYVKAVRAIKRSIVRGEKARLFRLLSDAKKRRDALESE